MRLRRLAHHAEGVGLAERSERARREVPQRGELGWTEDAQKYELAAHVEHVAGPQAAAIELDPAKLQRTLADALDDERFGGGLDPQRLARQSDPAERQGRRVLARPLAHEDEPARPARSRTGRPVAATEHGARTRREQRDLPRPPRLGSGPGDQQRQEGPDALGTLLERHLRPGHGRGRRRPAHRADPAGQPSARDLSRA